MLSDKTRLCLSIGTIILLLAEALISSFIKAFPFAELASAQVVLAGAYGVSKTIDNVKRSKYTSCGQGPLTRPENINGNHD
jgi:hypothetical protein